MQADHRVGARGPVETFGADCLVVAVVNPVGQAAGHEVEVQRAQNVGTVIAHEQAERPTDARIDVQQLVLAVAVIEAVADVEDSAVSDLLHQARGRVADRRICLTDAQRGCAGVWRRLPYLPARERYRAVRALVEITVEHPHAFGCAGDVFLQHDIAPFGRLHLPVDVH